MEQQSIFDGEHRYTVESESVAQFIGLDKNGLEVYEGGKLIDDPENEFTAEIYM